MKRANVSSGNSSRSCQKKHVTLCTKPPSANNILGDASLHQGECISTRSLYVNSLQQKVYFLETELNYFNMSGDAPPSQDEFISTQSLYIDNLQQQVYFLENELTYLRAHMERTNKMQPTVQFEAEKMVKKLAEYQREIQTAKVELKRKQTTIDLLKSERERLSKKMGEHETLTYHQNSSYLEEIVKLKKIKDEYQERCVELERTLQDKEQQENHFQGDYDSLHVQIEELNREMEEDKKLIETLQESKQQLQQSLSEANMQLELKSVSDQQETIKHMKVEIQELHGKLMTTERVAEHEKLLKTRLMTDNDALIKRHANVEAELAEVKAKLGEAQSIQTRLEDVHLKIVVDASEAKSKTESLKSQIESFKQRLKSEKERSFQLASDLADEQRFKTREEQKVIHMEKRMEQKEEKAKSREKENSDLLKTNASLKDQIIVLKNQLRNRDSEVENLKQKVMDMQVSVEEFVQNSRAATQLESQRWKQLTQLAKGIQALSKDAAISPD